MEETPTAVTQIEEQIIPLAATGNAGLPEVGDGETIIPLAEENGEEQELVEIEDEEVPLAVVDDEEEAEKEAEEELVEIEDEEVALAAGAVAEKVWWSWIPFIAVAASITDGYRRSRKNKKELSDGKKKE